MNRENEGGVGFMRRAEIDTRAPFRSVKEAVMLFGERVLAGEVYANKLNQIRAAELSNQQHHTARAGSIVAELEETKQNLEKAREESQMMTTYVISLEEELEKTKTELEQLKTRQVADSETEDIKFVENPTTEVAINIESNKLINQETEFQKKRSVKFANPPTLTQVINPEEEVKEQVLERQFSVDRERTRAKKKKKHLIPLIASIFTKKKGYENHY